MLRRVGCVVLALVVGVALMFSGAMLASSPRQSLAEWEVVTADAGDNYYRVVTQHGLVCTGGQLELANWQHRLFAGSPVLIPPWCQPGVAPTTSTTTTSTTTVSPATTTSTTSTTVPPTVGTTTSTTVAPTTSTTAVPTTTAPPSGAQFSETFDNNTGRDRFDVGIFHRDNGGTSGTVSADHDMACGNPDTQRTVSATDVNSSFYTCVNHLMVAIGHWAAYSTGMFTPKQTFTDVRSVSWDVGVTDLGARQWWEMMVVPASFNSGVASCRYCAVQDWLSPSPSGLPAYPADAIVIGNGPFGNTPHAHADGDDFNFAGWQHTCGDPWALDPIACASKAIRIPFNLVDNGNNTLTLTVGWTSGPKSYTFAGSFPDGDVKVVFKDHKYTPNKDGIPVGYTSHWDNIIIK